MSKKSLRFRILPVSAWRAIFIIAAMAIPFRSPVMHAAAAEAQPAPTATPATKDGKKKPSGKKKKTKAGKKKKSEKKTAETKKLTSTALIAEVEKGVAVIGKGAKEAKLDPKSKTAAPFLAALKKVATNTEVLKKQLAAKDKAYFKTLSDTATEIGRMRVAAPRIGLANKTINDGTKIVFDSFDALRGNFGKEAARKKQGGSLTDKEKATFAKLKSQQTDLVAKLTPVREKAAKAGNKKMVADIDGLFRQSRQVTTAKEDVNGFVLALELLDYLAGEYQAYTYYVPTDYRTEWAYVTPSFRETDTIYWDYYDSYEVNDWGYYETGDISYSYDYAEVSMSSTEISEYDSYAEDISSEEVSDDTYIDDASYEENLEANEESQDSSMEDTEEAIDDAADDDDNADDGDDADSDDGDSGDDDSGDDDSGDDDSGDDDSGDDDSGDDDSGDDDSGDDDSGDDDSSDDDSGDDDSGGDDGGGDDN